MADITTDIKYTVDVTDRQLQLLRRNNIKTVEKFLKRSTLDLQKILKVSASEILSTKRKLRGGYNIKADYETCPSTECSIVSCDKYFDDAVFKAETLCTGITQFDELLPAGGIFSGDVIEIIGRPASGKTMLMYTIILRVLESNENAEIFYFDTKNDFQAIKIKNIMTEQGMTEEVQQSILNRVFIKQVRSFSSLNAQLRHMRDAKYTFDKVKIIVIDSICTLAYFTLGDAGVYKRALRNTTLLIKALSGNNISFLISNLALRIFTRTEPPGMLKTEFSQSEKSQGPTEEPLPVFTVRPALGQRWTNVAHHKILVDFTDAPHRFETDCSTVNRTLSLFYSIASASSFPKNVHITDEGVI